MTLRYDPNLKTSVGNNQINCTSDLCSVGHKLKDYGFITTSKGLHITPRKRLNAQIIKSWIGT